MSLEDDTVEMGIAYDTAIYRRIRIGSSFGYLNSADIIKNTWKISQVQVDVSPTPAKMQIS